MPSAPPPLLLLLHQQTANVNAGAVTQVYKQQTEGPHQRLSLKDNRCCPPPHLPCLHSSPARASTPTLPLRPERCPLLSGVGGERGRSQCHPGSSASNSGSTTVWLKWENGSYSVIFLLLTNILKYQNIKT